VLVGGAGVAVTAPVKAATIRVDAPAEGDVRAVVLADDAAGALGEVLRPRVLERGPVFLVQRVDVALDVEVRGAVRRLGVRAAAVGGESAGHGIGAPDGNNCTLYLAIRCPARRSREVPGVFPRPWPALPEQGALQNPTGPAGGW